MIQEQKPGAEGPVSDDDAAARRPRPRHAEEGHPERDRHTPATVQSLKQAMRRARHDDAERVGVQTDQRIARLCRLELLQEALQPLLAQVPADVDLFDIGLMPGPNPRLFIDMIGFVEMGRDGRIYRLAQDTRHGRIQLAESAEIDAMVEAVTDYIARRLLERDKALASDTVLLLPRRGSAGAPRRGRIVATDAPPSESKPPRRRGQFLWLGPAFAFLIDLLGSIAFFTLLAGIGWLVWNRLHGQV